MITHQQLGELYLNMLCKPETVTNEDGTIERYRQAKNINHWKRLNQILPRVKGEVKDFNPLDDNVYCWSDQHWDHSNIIKYSNRPFTDKNHMNKSMIENYYETITDSDIVFFGGDIAFTREAHLIHRIADLPGYKILIVGNHDINNSGELMRTTDGFDEIHVCKVFNLDGWDLLFTHYPLRPVPQNCIGIHGHIHTRLTGDPFHVNICVEHTEYKPKKIKDLIQPALELL